MKHFFCKLQDWSTFLNDQKKLMKLKNETFLNVEKALLNFETFPAKLQCFQPAIASL